MWICVIMRPRPGVYTSKRYSIGWGRTRGQVFRGTLNQWTCACHRTASAEVGALRHSGGHIRRCTCRTARTWRPSRSAHRRDRRRARGPFACDGESSISHPDTSRSSWVDRDACCGSRRSAGAEVRETSAYESTSSPSVGQTQGSYSHICTGKQVCSNDFSGLRQCRIMRKRQSSSVHRIF